MLASKRILLGITGGIAAYKTTFLTRLLIKAGAEVRIVMTPASADFVSPLTLATLSKNKVLIDFVNKGQGNSKINISKIEEKGVLKEEKKVMFKEDTLKET